MGVGLEDQVGGLISSPVPICYIDTHVYNSLMKYFEWIPVAYPAFVDLMPRSL